MDHVGEGESALVFDPTDEEMVRYLLNKVTGKTPSMREVIECDLYGDEELWRKRFKGTRLNCLYFFTKLKKTSQKITRSSRATTWCNTWKAQSDKKICVGEKHIGSRRSFSLVEKGNPRDEFRWVMHEYRLDGVYDFHNQGNDYVLCRIRRRVSKKVAVKQEETPSPTFDSCSSFHAEGDGDDHQGNTSWAATFAEDLLANSQNSVEEEEEEEVLLPNQFYQDNWVRGWERVGS